MTAPTKLHELIDDALETMELHGMHEESSYKNLKLAALAPPSGEGVDTPLVQRLGMLVTMLRAEAKSGRRGYNFGEDAANRRSGRIADEIEQAIHEVRVLGKSHPQTAQEAERCRTTPQSAPVDGDWRKFYSVEVKSDPPFPYGVAVITDANGEQSVHVHDDNPVLWHLLNKLTTPPPASQERGGLQVFHCREADDGEVGCAKWCGNRTYCPVSGQAEPSPPSSAAECTRNCDCVGECKAGLEERK